MPRIRELDGSLQRQITASSSIDSPVAAIKELIDNSLDARAKSITIVVDVATSGLFYTVVKDDGDGVPEEDIASVCLKHTTSKLSGADGFGCCKTLGFRGQALHYIAHLTNGDLQLTSRNQNATVGSRWSVDDRGEINKESLQKVTVKKGTEVQFRGLFDKYPVRKKILSKSATTFKKQLIELVHQYAIVNRGVRFELRRVNFDGKKITGHTGEPQIITTGCTRRELLVQDAKSPLIQDMIPIDSTAVEYLIHLKFAATKAHCSFGKTLSINGRLMNLGIGVGKEMNRVINQVFTNVGMEKPDFWFVELQHSDLGIMSFNIQPKKDDVLIPEFTRILETFALHLKCKLMQDPKLTKNLDHQTPQKSISVNNPLSLQKQLFEARVKSKTSPPNLTAKYASHCQSSTVADDGDSNDETETTNEWSHSMHERLSSWGSSSVGSITVESQATMVRDGIDEDLEISRNIQISNPFTLAKMAYNRRENIDSEDLQTSQTQIGSVKLLALGKDPCTITRGGSPRQEKIKFTPACLPAYTRSLVQGETVKKRLIQAPNPDRPNETKTPDTRKKRKIEAVDGIMGLTTTHRRLQSTPEGMLVPQTRNTIHLTLEKIDTMEVPQTKGSLPSQVICPSEISTHIKYCKVRPIIEELAHGDKSGANLCQARDIIDACLDNIDLNFSLTEFISYKLTQGKVEMELHIKDSGDWLILC